MFRWSGGGKPRAVTQSGLARRAMSWAVWWILLMVIWIIVDNSVGRDELLVGAGAAAIAAMLVEAATWQAEVRLGVRVSWLLRALKLPGRVLADTVTVFAALARQLLTGAEPRSGFVAEPVSVREDAEDTAEARMRLALLVAERSLAPNRFAVGIDADRGVMVAHALVLGDEETPS